MGRRKNKKMKIKKRTIKKKEKEGFPIKGRKEETPKMGFPLPTVTYLAENLSGWKVL